MESLFPNPKMRKRVRSSRDNLRAEILADLLTNGPATSVRALASRMHRRHNRVYKALATLLRESCAYRITRTVGGRRRRLICAVVSEPIGACA
jgi:predicted transcriptional regulator